jgi:hypothetical protein
MTDYTYGTGSNWLDRDFSYWDDRLLPTPREVMSALQSNPSGNLADVVRNFFITNVEDQVDAESILQTFIFESGNTDLMEKYGL